MLGIHLMLTGAVILLFVSIVSIIAEISKEIKQEKKSDKTTSLNLFI